MAATALTVTTTAAAGTVWPAGTAVDLGNGNSFTNTGREAMIVTNTSGGVLTVTIVTSGVYGVGSVNYAVADVTATQSNNVSRIYGPFDTTLFGSSVSVSWSTGTNVTANVLSLGSA